MAFANSHVHIEERKLFAWEVCYKKMREMLHKWESPVQWFRTREELTRLDIHRSIKIWGWGGDWSFELFFERVRFSLKIPTQVFLQYMLLLFFLTFCHIQFLTVSTGTKDIMYTYLISKTVQVTSTQKINNTQ